MCEARAVDKNSELVALLYRELKQERAARTNLQEQLWQLNKSAAAVPAEPLLQLPTAVSSLTDAGSAAHTGHNCFAAASTWQRGGEGLSSSSTAFTEPAQQQQPILQQCEFLQQQQQQHHHHHHHHHQQQQQQHDLSLPSEFSSVRQALQQDWRACELRNGVCKQQHHSHKQGIYHRPQQQQQEQQELKLQLQHSSNPTRLVTNHQHNAAAGVRTAAAAATADHHQQQQQQQQAAAAAKAKSQLLQDDTTMRHNNIPSHSNDQVEPPNHCIYYQQQQQQQQQRQYHCCHHHQLHRHQALPSNALAAAGAVATGAAADLPSSSSPTLRTPHLHTPQMPPRPPAAAFTPLSNTTTHNACWSETASGSNPTPRSVGTFSSSSSGLGPSAAGAAALDRHAAELLWGAAEVRRSNDQQLLAASVLSSSSSSDSDQEDPSCFDTAWVDDSGCSRCQQAGLPSIRQYCRDLGTQQFNYSQLTQQYIHNPSGTCELRFDRTFDREFDQRSEAGDRQTALLMTSNQGQLQGASFSSSAARLAAAAAAGSSGAAAAAAAAAVVGASSGTVLLGVTDTGAHRTSSWRDSWDEDIGAFCDGLEVLHFSKATAATEAGCSRPVIQQQQQQQQQGPSAQLAAAAVQPGADNLQQSARYETCGQLHELLLQLEFEKELAAAQLAVVCEERDLLAMQQQSLLHIMAEQQMGQGPDAHVGCSSD